MTKRLRPALAALATAGALAVATGCGTSTDDSTANAAQPQQQQQQGRPGSPPNLSALATKLGVTEAKLQTAMQAARPTQGGNPADMAASLAKQLGLSTAKVEAAMEATMPKGAPPSQGAVTGAQ